MLQTLRNSERTLEAAGFCVELGNAAALAFRALSFHCMFKWALHLKRGLTPWHPARPAAAPSQHNDRDAAGGSIGAGSVPSERTAPVTTASLTTTGTDSRGGGAEPDSDSPHQPLLQHHGATPNDGHASEMVVVVGHGGAARHPWSRCDLVCKWFLVLVTPAAWLTALLFTVWALKASHANSQSRDTDSPSPNSKTTIVVTFEAVLVALTVALLLGLCFGTTTDDSELAEADVKKTREVLAHSFWAVSWLLKMYATCGAVLVTFLVINPRWAVWSTSAKEFPTNNAESLWLAAASLATIVACFLLGCFADADNTGSANEAARDIHEALRRRLAGHARLNLRVIFVTAWLLLLFTTLLVAVDGGRMLVKASAAGPSGAKHHRVPRGIRALMLVTLDLRISVLVDTAPVLLWCKSVKYGAPVHSRIIATRVACTALQASRACGGTPRASSKLRRCQDRNTFPYGVPGGLPVYE
jgi:hypothetical protein